MNRKLTPWLVVALVAGAFATGLLGAVMIVGGPSAGHVTSGSQSTSTTTASTPAAAGATAARAQTSSAAHRSASARATTSSPAGPRPKAPPETSQGTGGTPANSPVAVLTPEPNPVAVRTPATTRPATLPMPSPTGPGAAGTTPAPAASPSSPPAAKEGKSSVAGELVEADSSTRLAALGQTLRALQSDLASVGAITPGAQRFVQELCGEFAHSSLSAEGAFSGC